MADESEGAQVNYRRDGSNLDVHLYTAAGATSRSNQCLHGPGY